MLNLLGFFVAQYKISHTTCPIVVSLLKYAPYLTSELAYDFYQSRDHALFTGAMYSLQTMLGTSDNHLSFVG